MSLMATTGLSTRIQGARTKLKARVDKVRSRLKNRGGTPTPAPTTSSMELMSGGGLMTRINSYRNRRIMAAPQGSTSGSSVITVGPESIVKGPFNTESGGGFKPSSGPFALRKA